MSRSFIALISMALMFAACSGDDAAETTIADTTTSTSVATTTTAPETTTTTVDDRPRSPINGMPVDDEALLDRRVIAVKVDNHPNARPQSGIQEADALFEIRVEGGITRFMAIFHDGDAEYLGPIRSGRPTDAKLIRALEATLFISGAQGWVQQGIRNVGITFFVQPDGMFRIGSRRAPHNLYGSTVELRAFADTVDVPDTPPPAGLWEFGELPDDAIEVETIDVAFSSGFDVQWQWNGEQWERWFNDAPSQWSTEEGEESTISADTLVLIVGRYFTDGPSAGQGGSAVPSTDTVGEGRVVVAHGGTLVEGTWARESAEDPFTFTTLDGEPLPVPPGFMFGSIVPDSSGGDIGWE
jgi:hypothetical protein